MTKNRFIAATTTLVFAVAGATTALVITHSDDITNAVHTPLIPLIPLTNTITPATLPHCEYEDSDNCIWDAMTDGNGEGASFIAWEGQVYYLDFLACDAPMEVAPDKDPADGSSWAFCA